MRILAVDDDPTIHDMLEHYLSVRQGINLTSAMNAQEALEIIAEQDTPFEAVLLDIIMPGLDGVELCGRIRRKGRYRTTPIIMITASREPKQMARAFAAGATDFVAKPFEPLELTTRIRIARLLNDSLLREKQNQRNLLELKRLTQTGFGDRSAMKPLEGIYDLLQIENSLLRRTENCFAMSLFAIEIANARQIYETAGAAEFRACLDRVAHALAAIGQPLQLLFAYAGHGVFLAVRHGRQRINCHAVAGEVQEILDESDPGGDTLSMKPHVRACEVSGNRLWTGLAASNAINGFLERRERGTTTAQEEKTTVSANRGKIFG